jgi:multicomponent Na+:H+ antiporter subunit B
MMRTLMRPLVVALQLFGVYVVIHGHYSPGGGFQGGVLLGAALILPFLVHGRKTGRPAGLLVVNQHGALAIAAVGVMIFAAVGIVPMLFGAAPLDYAAIPMPGVKDAMRRSYGILGIEIGVTLGVAGAATCIFHALYSDIEEEPD